MDDDIIDESTMKGYKRHRFLSCSAINDQTLSPNLIQRLPRKHRHSVIEEFSCVHSNYPQLKTSNSDPATFSINEIGVKSFENWRPRKNSKTPEIERGESIACRATFTLNEDRVMTEMNVDTKRVLEGKAEVNKMVWYKVNGSQNNPFRSDLFVRVLYLIGSIGTVENDAQQNAHIRDQFLTEQQIREGQLREQRDGVERMKHDMVASGDVALQPKSGTVTPAEFIYQSIPNLIKRNSFTNLRSEHVSSQLAFMDDKKVDCGPVSVQDIADHHHIDTHHFKTKNSHKLSGREKSMLAPLTF